MAAPGTRVWDAPTRIVHWLLVAGVAFSWWSAEAHHFDWHRISGLFVLLLLLFRLIWGFVGSDTARFSKFLRGPAATWRYARTLPDRAAETAVGHNPLGGWSIVAMLLALVAQVGLGLFAVDMDGLESGPLSDLVSYEAGRQAAEIHEAAFNVLMALIALHVVAILFYAVYKRRDLVRPMITGRARIDAAEPLRFSSAARALVAMAVAATVTWFVANGLKF